MTGCRLVLGTMLASIALAIAAAPARADDAGPDGLLPETGSAVPWWLVVAGAGLVLGGVTLVAAGRRREDQHE